MIAMSEVLDFVASDRPTFEGFFTHPPPAALAPQYAAGIQPANTVCHPARYGDDVRSLPSLASADISPFPDLGGRYRPAVGNEGPSHDLYPAPAARPHFRKAQLAVLSG